MLILSHLVILSIKYFDFFEYSFNFINTFVFIIILYIKTL